MLKRVIAAAVAAMVLCGPTLAAEPIVGQWRTAEGSIAQIGPCSAGFCVTLTSGQHQGRQIGQMSGSGANYSGTITDPASDRTYQGSAVVSGSQLSLTGCALRVFCRTQTWTKA